MKFNTKTIHGGQHQTKHWGCYATHISNNYFAQTSPGHPMGIMNTVELQTLQEQL
jgi:pyruvate/2-oxoacid:ferredoxin oxidoreductase beta subunit